MNESFRELVVAPGEPAGEIVMTVTPTDPAIEVLRRRVDELEGLLRERDLEIRRLKEHGA